MHGTKAMNGDKKRPSTRGSLVHTSNELTDRRRSREKRGAGKKNEEKKKGRDGGTRRR